MAYPILYRIDLFMSQFLKVSPRKTKGAKNKSQKSRSNRRKN